jgi:hypothetical protein
MAIRIGLVACFHFFHVIIIPTFVTDAMWEFFLAAAGTGVKSGRGQGVVGAAGALAHFGGFMPWYRHDE